MNEKLIKELTRFELHTDAKSALELLERAADGERTVRVCLRVLFVVLDALVEGRPNDSEEEFLARRFSELFRNSFAKFSQDPEFLCFCGMMITKAEWYFDKEFEDGVAMMEQAIRLSPQSILYRAMYIVFSDQRDDSNTNAKIETLTKFFAVYPNKLEEFGMLGDYVVGIFESVLEVVSNEEFFGA